MDPVCSTVPGISPIKKRYVLPFLKNKLPDFCHDGKGAVVQAQGVVEGRERDTTAFEAPFIQPSLYQHPLHFQWVSLIREPSDGSQVSFSHCWL